MSKKSSIFEGPVVRIAALLMGIVLFACGGDDGSAPGSERTKLVITGSSTVAPLVNEIAGRFEKEHPGVRVDVQTGGSSRGMADVRRGLADLGMVSRSPKDGEEDLRWHPIARDGLAIIVHRDNPVDALTEDQIEAIYRGEVDDWAAVGGNGEPITVVSKAEGRSTLEVFLKHFDLASSDIEAGLVIGDNQQGIKTVAGNPGAVAYVSIGTAEFEADRGTPLKLVRLGEAVPSTEAVRAGAYPIARTLHLVTLGEPDGWAAKLVDYARSPAVHDLVEGQFFVPLAE